MSRANARRLWPECDHRRSESISAPPRPCCSSHMLPFSPAPPGTMVSSSSTGTALAFVSLHIDAHCGSSSARKIETMAPETIDSRVDRLESRAQAQGDLTCLEADTATPIVPGRTASTCVSLQRYVCATGARSSWSSTRRILTDPERSRNAASLPNRRTRSRYGATSRHGSR